MGEHVMRTAAFSVIIGAGNEIDWAGLAGFFRSVAYVAVAAAAVILSYGVAWSMIHQRKVTASIDSRLGHLEVGVNGIENDEQPLIGKVRDIQGQVGDLRTHQRSVVATLNRICEHLHIPNHDSPVAG